MTADLLQGDLPATVLDVNMKGHKNSRGAIWAFLILYICHTVAYVLESKSGEKNKLFTEIRRKMFIPLATFGSYYLLNNTIGWFPHILMWIVMLSYTAANAACFVPQLQEENLKKYVFSAAHGSAIFFWLIYFIMQLVEY
jgi:hypothetical protein